MIYFSLLGMGTGAGKSAFGVLDGLRMHGSSKLIMNDMTGNESIIGIWDL